MSIGVIVGLLVSAAIIAIAWLIQRMSRPGAVYPGPGRGAGTDSDGGAMTAATMVALSGAIPASNAHGHHHSDASSHGGSFHGSDGGGFHGGGFDGGGGHH